MARSSLTRVALSLAGAALCAGVAAAPAPQQVDLPLPSGIVLRAYWLQAQGGGPHPAVLALHGCGGLYNSKGDLSQRYREAFERLHAAGVSVLMPDSFGARGLRQVCQTRYRERSVGVGERARDAQAALRWLARQPQVQRIGVLGWSNGATTTLTLLEQRERAKAPAEPPIAGAAVFYPGCAPLLRRRAQIEPVPLLMQLGALDDWTPPGPCEDFARLLQATPGSDVTLHVYPDSYHGFDGKAPVRWHADVPNGVSNRGVHQGGNPQARAQALAALDAFWSRVLGARAAP